MGAVRTYVNGKKVLYSDRSVKNIKHLSRQIFDNYEFRKDLREIWWEGVDWMHLAQDRDQCRAVVNTVMYLRVP
jgi:hypothetical protein